MKKNLEAFSNMIRGDLANIRYDMFCERSPTGALLIGVFLGSWLYSFVMSAALKELYMDSIMPFISFGLLLVATGIARKLEDSTRSSYVRIMIILSFILLATFIGINL